MNKKTKVGIPLAVIMAIAGGSYAFDFSTTSTSVVGDTNIEGDTIFNLPDEKQIADEILRAICDTDAIPPEYEVVCEKWKNEP